MKKTDQSVSTTKRLQVLQQGRIKTALFFSYIFVLVLVCVGFCYMTDSAAAGITDPVELWRSTTRELALIRPERGKLPIIEYTVTTAEGRSQTTDISRLFYVTLALSIIGMFWNSLVVFMVSLNSRNRIQKQLEPVYDLAQAAMRLSTEENTRPKTASSGVPHYAYDPNRIHDLESAIDNIKPDRPNAQLHTDDADLKGLESAINSLLLRARESSEQQIRFVSDASHELRTPIAVIKGYTDMLDRWGKDDETILDESIAAIKTETEHMNTLVEQLLFLARGDSGRTQLKMEQFSLSDMVREVCDESMMIDSEHKWCISAENEVIAYGDVALLKQAIRILVDNARKYTPEGETIILRARYDDGGMPSVVVQDTGIGIAAEDMSHVFDRFYRSDPARVREKGGTGLGLSIAKWIVDRHEGYFELLSRPEFGTRITIHLPAKPMTSAENSV